MDNSFNPQDQGLLACCIVTNISYRGQLSVIIQKLMMRMGNDASAKPKEADVGYRGRTRLVSNPAPRTLGISLRVRHHPFHSPAVVTDRYMMCQNYLRCNWWLPRTHCRREGYARCSTCRRYSRRETVMSVGLIGRWAGPPISPGPSTGTESLINTGDNSWGILDMMRQLGGAQGIAT